MGIAEIRRDICVRSGLFGLGKVDDATGETLKLPERPVGFGILFRTV
jgi:hypothetical protein